MSTCVFCDIIWDRAPATVTYNDPSVIAIVPLNPVVPGHELVIPKMHVADFTENHHVTADTMAVAALIARDRGPMNLITSRGREATQSVFHLHVHLVPRAENDGLALPWYSGKAKRDHVAEADALRKQVRG
jgi:histidine triad (HIT) family protein